MRAFSNKHLFNLGLDGLNLAGELSGFISCYGGSDDWASDTACTSQSNLGWNKDIWHILRILRLENVKRALNGIGAHLVFA